MQRTVNMPKICALCLWPSPVVALAESWLENICNLGYSDQKHLFLHWSPIAANPYF